MRKSKLRLWLPVGLGMALILTAGLWLGVNALQARQALAEMAETVTVIERILPERTAGTLDGDEELPKGQIGDTDYVGLLQVQGYGVLPVQAQWSSQNIKKSPCCYDGTVYDGSLIIGGTDAEGQFDFVSRVDVGDRVTFTDMTGQEFVYQVKIVNHASHATTETLHSGQDDLTLFARKSYSSEYLIVRCELN